MTNIQFFLNRLKQQSNTEASTTSEVMDLVLSKGGSIDAFFLYESTFIENIELRNIRKGDKGELVICYSNYSVLNEYPFYTLGSQHGDEKDRIIDKFYDFLISEESQEDALRDGIRPSNSEVAKKLLNDEKYKEYFKTFENSGIKVLPHTTKYDYPSGSIIILVEDVWGN